MARSGASRGRRLVDRAEEICAVMVAYEHPELPEPGRAWLREHGAALHRIGRELGCGSA